ncbi:interferon alpha/beta receptor 2 isoform X2 [Tachyglossus aculeatus]|uniref:interferon alpha/beta receptor 2 isoform X2 n=1 Tax=Tachyglossus aculeatus TaxID=9261 RepID=UPI0018F7ADFB|nr:interferon alpha/beta receptor 2 isoform X2 [Tachyglossus aculeatus]
MVLRRRSSSSEGTADILTWETPASCSPFTLKMKSQNFHHNLTWGLNDCPVTPTRFTVQYTAISQGDNFTEVSECTRTPRFYCDVTNRFVDVGETYITLVQGFAGDRVFTENLEFMPIKDTTLGPPEVHIAALEDQIEVTVHLPEGLLDDPKTPSNPWPFHEFNGLTGTIKVASMNRPEESRLIKIKDIHGGFSSVVEGLFLNTNYCITAEIHSPLNTNSQPSDLKCTVLASSVKSEPIKSQVVGGTFVFVFLLIFGLLSLMALKIGGCICLRRKRLPKVLDILTLPFRVFQDPLPEKTFPVEIICRPGRRRPPKRMPSGSDPSDDDSEDEESESGGYMGHVLSCIATVTGQPSEHEEDSEPGGASEPEGDPEPEEPGGWGAGSLHPGLPAGVASPEGTDSRVWDPVPEEDCFPGDRLGNRGHFNIDLSSVFVKIAREEAVGGNQSSSPAPDCPVQTELEPLLPADLGVKSSPAPASPRWDLSSEGVSSEDGGSSEEDLGDGYITR